MIPASELPVLPVDRLTQPRERFRCEPYRCTLTAEACLKRQRQAQTNRGGTIGREPMVTTHCADCADCALGRVVAQRVKLTVEPVKCSVASCNAIVEGAKGREPLCPAHRSSRVWNGTGAVRG